MRITKGPEPAPPAMLWRSRLGWIVVCLLISLGATPAASPRRVLIVHSFGRDFAPLDTLSQTFRTELARESPEPVEFFEVSIETARFAEAGDEKPLIDYVRTLFSQRRLDLILTVAEPATHFCLRHRSELFPETPLLAHVDHRQLPAVLGATNATIAPVYIKIPILLENILQVLPGTTNMFMVLGGSPFERHWAEQCRREFAPFSNRVSVSFANDLPLEKICERVAGLPQNSAVLYAMLAVDAAGVPYEQEKALASLRAAANAPVFGVFESQLGHGIVGGPLLSQENSGRQAARTALELLRGRKARDIAIPPPDPVRLVYDWRELRRWGIDPGRLPQGSSVRFRPPTLWEDHRGLILATAAVFLAQMVTIAALLLNRARRRRSEAALRESEQRLNLAADAANLGLWVWDVVRDEFWATVKCRAFFGFTPEERVSFADFAARVHPEDRTGMEQAVRRALEKNAPYDVEYRACPPDGSTRWIGARGVVVVNESGQPTRMLGICIDLTQKKQADTEIQRQRAELAHVARVSTMGELAASVAHELNQPLGAILSNAEAAEIFLNQDPPALGELREILADIRKDDERAGEVIRRMRTLLRKHELEQQPLEVNSVVEDVLRLVSADAALRKTAITAELATGLPKIQGDRIHLQQVLLNLILNAFEAMASQPVEKRRLLVRTGRNNGFVEVAVTDFGPGIEPDKQSRLFQPFFTTKPNGMGMGLSIARTIIEAHRGSINAVNNPGGGATFRFTLPASKEEIPH